MEPIPLIPKAKEKGNHDVSCILREAFQDFLVKEILPSNVSYNLQKYRTDNALLKSTAVNAHHVSLINFLQLKPFHKKKIRFKRI